MILLNLISIIISYVILAIFIYNNIITLWSVRISKREKKREFIKKEETTFCVLIPCHNEEEVIESTLGAINKTNYNKDLYKVYVIADNCSDSTVEVCKNYVQANNMHNCRILEVKGGSKPKALNNAVNILKKENLWNTDSIVILDADNKVSPSIFKSFNEEHLKGHKLVQCAIHSLNDSSFVAKGFTSAFNNMNRGFQLARNRIGLSGSLSGTGFSIDRKVWDDVDFIRCSTLTEDLEFSILSILQGYKIKFVFNDYVLNQHLDEFKPSMVQRVRWARGHMQVYVRLSKYVLKSFIKKPSFQLLDSYLFISTPLRNITYLISLVAEIIMRHMAHVPFLVLLTPVVYWLLFIMICNHWKFKYLIPSIMYTLTMFIATVYGVITYRNTVWAKTTHKKLEECNN